MKRSRMLDKLFYMIKVSWSHDDVSNEEHIKRLLDDWIEFKLYAAEQHLSKLKEIANVHGDISKSNARIEVELEGTQHLKLNSL